MDINAMKPLLDGMLKSISPETLEAVSVAALKLCKEMRETGQEFSIDHIQKLIETDEEIRQIANSQTPLQSIQVTLKVTQSEIDNEKTKKFRAKPFMSSGTSERKLFRLKLIKDQYEYTISSPDHGDVFVKIEIVEKL